MRKTPLPRKDKRGCGLKAVVEVEVDFGQDTGCPYWPIVFGPCVGSQEGGTDCFFLG